MKKGIIGLMMAVVLFVSCEDNKKPATAEGDWKYEKYVEGTAAMSAQQEAVSKSIVSVFEDCEASFDKDGNVVMSNKMFKDKKGTYSITNNELNVEFGPGSQFIVNIENAEGKLIINLGKDNPKEAGQIFLVKK